MEKIGSFDIPPNLAVDELVERYRQSGSIGSGRIFKGIEILTKMVKEEECTVFLGLAGPIVPSGFGYTVVELIKEDFVDVIVSTGANLSHDLLEELGGNHLRGSPHVDDKKLKKKGISRVYDIFIEEEGFQKFEEGVQDLLKDLPKKVGIKDLLKRMGSKLSENCILGAAAKNDVDIYCPGLQDSILGIQIWMYCESNVLEIPAFKDVGSIMETGFTSKKTGAFLLGGGVPKNYILQTMMTAGDGFDYALQLTTDFPETGGLSGATLEESISWGKLKGEGVTVYGDATITFPLIVSAMRTNIWRKKKV